MLKRPRIKVARPERSSKPSKRTLLQAIGFVALVGAAGYYMMKPDAKAPAGKAAVKVNAPGKAAAKRQPRPNSGVIRTAASVDNAGKPGTVPSVVQRNGKAPAKPIKAAGKTTSKGNTATPGVAVKGQPKAVVQSPGELVPHDATYRVEAFPVGRSKAPAIMKGTAELRYMLYCGTWTFQSGYRYKGLAEDGPDPVSIMIVHKESVDGRRYAIDYRWHQFGTSTITKAVAKTAPDGPGEAFADNGGARTLLSLPKGTIFPVAYLKQLIAAASAGKREYLATAYGKSSPNLLLKVRAVITPFNEEARRKMRKGVPGVRMPERLQSNRIWQIDYAYHDSASQDRERLFRASIAINAKGVTFWTRMDVGDMQVVSTLAGARVVPTGPCRKKNKAKR